jgi:hypothetical protein
MISFTHMEHKTWLNLGTSFPHLHLSIWVIFFRYLWACRIRFLECDVRFFGTASRKALCTSTSQPQRGPWVGSSVCSRRGSKHSKNSVKRQYTSLRSTDMTVYHEYQPDIYDSPLPWQRSCVSFCPKWKAVLECGLSITSGFSCL